MTVGLILKAAVTSTAAFVFCAELLFLHAMSSSGYDVHVHRILIACAVAHALLLSVWAVPPLNFWNTSFVTIDLWVAFTTLWLFWPVILIVHGGRSLTRVLVALLVSAVILYPVFREYPYLAPRAFGLPEDIHYFSVPTIHDYYTGYHAGRAEAENDLRSGHLAHEEVGMPMPEEYYHTLKRYEIEPHIYGDVIGEKILGHVKGYNEISEPAIRQKFGSDVIAAARDEAIEHWKQAQAKAAPSP